MTTIEDHFRDLMRAYGARDYKRALRIARCAHAEHPTQHAKTLLWTACMHSLLGSQSDAIEALAEGLAEGIWWGPKSLDAEHDLDPIREVAQFAEVRAECGRRWRKAREESRPECMAIRPPSGTEPAGVLMAIHWRGDNSVEFSRRWRHLPDRRGWILLAPQSSQPFDCDTFCWDDAERGRAELRTHWDEFFAMEGRRFPRLVIAGSSQGGRLAFELAQEKGVPYLCMIPSFPRDYKPQPGGGGAFARGVFLLGEDDPANSRTRSVIAALEAAGAEAATRLMKGVGHDFPTDFPAYLDEILAELP